MPSGLIGQARHRHFQMMSSHSAKGGAASSNPVPSSSELPTNRDVNDLAFSFFKVEGANRPMTSGAFVAQSFPNDTAMEMPYRPEPGQSHAE